MTVNTAIEQLLEVEEARGESGTFTSFMLLLEKMIILQQKLSWLWQLTSNSLFPKGEKVTIKY